MTKKVYGGRRMSGWAYAALGVVWLLSMCAIVALEMTVGL